MLKRNYSGHMIETGLDEAGRSCFAIHEHYDVFGIINMNGRCYDPWLGRMLSPDNYVQAAGYSQNYNRFSYALNNPIKYTDPDGNFFTNFLTALVVDFFNTGFSKGGFEFWNWGSTNFNNAWAQFDPGVEGNMTNNAWKIEMGMIKTDPNKNFWGQSWELISRITWQAPQTALGYAGSGIHNLFYGVRSVHYYGGATVVESYSENWGAIALGNYINGSRGISANPSDRLFQHEYGHYLQSQSSGLFYFSKYGIPSVLSKDPHNFHPAEQDANVRAFSYFSKHVDGFNWVDEFGIQQSKWVNSFNPITGYDWSLQFDNLANQAALKNGKLSLSWYDFIIGPDIVSSGLLNTLILNRQY